MIIFLALFLLFNSVGISVYAHYCGEDLQNTSLIVEAEKSCCSDESEEEPMGCCNDEHKLIKIEDEFLKVEHLEINVPDFTTNFIAIIPFNIDLNLLSLENTAATINRIKSPPYQFTSHTQSFLSIYRI